MLRVKWWELCWEDAARNSQKSENGGNGGWGCKSFVGQVGFKNGGSGSTGLRYNGEIR